MAPETSIIALDVGTVRIGVARALSTVRIASPLTTLTNDSSVWMELHELITKEGAETVVIGIPRGLDGQETDQTRYCRQFARDLAQHSTCAIELQDEAVTSVKAEEELQQRGKPYEKSDIDALAATYILEDYLQERM